MIPRIETFRRGLYALGTYWFVATLPFQWSFLPTSLGLMVFGLAWILRRSWKDALVGIFKNPFFLFCLIYYLVLSISLIWSCCQEDGLRSLGLKIPLLAWPLAFSGSEKHLLPNIKNVLKVFVLAAGISAFLLISFSTIQYFEHHEIEVFFYHKLMHWKLIPAHYTDLYFSFAASLSFYWLISGEFKEKNFHKALYYISLILFITVIALSAIRIQWLVLGLGLSLSLLFAFKQNLGFSRTWFIIPGVAIIAMALSPSMQRRLLETRDEWQALIGKETLKQTNARYYLWKHGFQLVKDKPYFGYGIGGANEALHQSLKHETAQFWIGDRAIYLYQTRYNLHSEFLQNLITVGIIGFIIFILILFYPYIKLKSDFYSMLFLTVSALSFTTESMLERQAGVFFFGFFYGLIIVTSLNRNKAGL